MGRGLEGSEPKDGFQVEMRTRQGQSWEKQLKQAQCEACLLKEPGDLGERGSWEVKNNNHQPDFSYKQRVPPYHLLGLP